MGIVVVLLWTVVHRWRWLLFSPLKITSSWPPAAQKKQTWQAKEARNGESFEKEKIEEDTQELKTYSFWFSWVQCVYNRAAPVLAHAFMLLAMPFLIHVKITGSGYICVHFLSLSLLGSIIVVYIDRTQTVLATIFYPDLIMRACTHQSITKLGGKQHI